MEVEIGIGKSGRRAYGFDDIAIVPSRRTRDPEDVDISWEVDAYKFELPMMAAAMDGVVSPATAIEIGRLGGLACLNLEGLWTRYEDPDAGVRGDRDARRPRRRRAGCRSSTTSRSRPSSSAQRIREIKDGGVTACRVAHAAAGRAVRQARPRRRARRARRPGHGRVGRARVADPARQPLNLKKFIREFELPVIVGGCASYSHRAAPHAHRRGRRARRCRPGPRVHDAAACSASVCRRRRRSPTPRARASVTSTRPACTCTSSPTAACDRRRHRQGDRVRRRRGDDRLAARRRVRGARPRLPLGHGHVPPHAAARRAGARRPAGRRSPRSSSVPRTRTTARSTSSVRCARRWPRPATRRSRNSRRPR